MTAAQWLRLTDEQALTLGRVFMYADSAWRRQHAVRGQAVETTPFGPLWEEIDDQFAAQMYKERPTVVCLCGSTRFWREFQAASLRETLAGRIVLSIGAASGTDDEHFGNMPPAEYDRVKAELDELHLRKIDLADEVLILNKDGYIGPSTSRELEYARSNGKQIRFLEG